jgi:YD repeat-containing protein
MRKIFFSVLMGYSSLAFAQNNDQAAVKLPQVLPPAPEAASMIKASQLSVGLHTGAAQATIPVHELKAGELSFPVSLNYASNGFKVDAIPGRVGMDWSLSLGVVSRTVHGIPDEKATHSPMPANLYANTQEVLDYYEYISGATTYPSGSYEGEPDEFNYSAPGISGKFILDYATGAPIPLGYSKNKINVVRNLVAQEIVQVIITATNGHRYFFGGSTATEQTITHNMSGAYFSRQSIKTSFFLYRIENVYGDYIQIDYLPLTIQTRPGVSMGISSTAGPAEMGSSQCPEGTQCPTPGQLNIVNLNGKATQITYETVYPTNINGSAGSAVLFSYENRPDLGGDKRLTTITIWQDGKLLKSAVLSYITPAGYTGAGLCFNTGVAEFNKRYFLSGVGLQSSDGQSPPLNYTFAYNDIQGLPYRLSYSQDMFGFYNGKYNSTLLPPTSYNNFFGTYATANRTPDGAYSAKGLLTQINYPTGGSETFVYEPNTIPNNGVNMEAGGVRVKQVKSYDPVSQKEIAKHYKYATLAEPGISSGTAPLNAQYISFSHSSQFCLEFSAVPLNCRYVHLNANSVSSLFYFQNNHIGYNCITESDDANNVNGAIEHYFITDITGPLSMAVRGDLLHNVPGETVTSMNGIEHRTRVVNSTGQTVKDTYQEYSFDNRIYPSYSAVAGVKKYLYQPPAPMYDKCNSFDITLYQYQPKWLHLDKTTVKEYNAANGQMMENVTNYYYDQLHHLQPNRITTTNSEGETLVTEKKFAQDLTGETYPQGQHPYQAMVSANILDPVIEERIFRNTVPSTSTQINYTRNEMMRLNDGVKPAYMNMQKGTNAMETRIRYHKYSDAGQLLEMSKENDTRVSFIWDYQQQLPVAEAVNASWNDIAYTSFEADGTGNWSVPGQVQQGTAFTGNMYYPLAGGNITNGKFESSKHLNYIIQCWVNNTANITVNGSVGTELLFKNGWRLVEFKLNDPATITISGTALVDELRMFPEKAQMKTLTYLTGVGALTVNDARNNVSFYEYDGFGRLLRIRDMDRNIMKQVDYKYGQSIVPCANTAANWLVTGVTRCQKNAQNCNTGIQEREERDMNNCSSTYYNTRWVSNGANAACQSCTATTCTGNDKKCVNCVCETGIRVNLSSVYHPATGLYTCTYYYRWSDFSTSVNYTEQNSTPCDVGD